MDMIRWNVVLLILGVLLVLDALLIMSRDLSHSASRESLLRDAGIPSRDEAHVHLGSKAKKKIVERSVDKKQEGEEEITDDERDNSQKHLVAGLRCDAYGGPSEEDAAEMVYWQDIPSDALYVSPLKAAGPEIKYLTFEPDEGELNTLKHNWAFVIICTRIIIDAKAMALLHKVVGTTYACPWKLL